MPTPIQWCDETFNPWWGCERVSPACAHCYADTFARRLGMSELWPRSQSPGVTEHGFRFFGDKHWDEPLKWARKLPAKLGRRPRIFCASMADVFEDRLELTDEGVQQGSGYPMGPRTRLFNLIAATPELDWLLLTKRPEFARDYLRDFYDMNDGSGELDVLENVWLGVSIENARYTWRADVLREIPAAVRFISAEPLLGSLYPPGVTRTWDDHDAIGAMMNGRRAPLDLSEIDWVIIGGESGPKARPFHLDHAREIVRAARGQCDGSCGGGTLLTTCTRCVGPAVFVKQLGAKPVESVDRMGISFDAALKLRDRKGGDMAEWPADLRIREFPHVAVHA